MLRNKHAFALIAAGTLSVMCGAAFAADLSIAPSPHAVQKGRAAGDKRHAGKTQGKKAQLAQTDKSKLAEQSRIVTYSLYRDPLSRLSGPSIDKRHFELPSRVAGLGSGLGYTVSPPATAVNTSRAPSAFDADPAENAPIAFGCSQKPFTAGTMRNELTACFRHNVDKSWKAQTFVSRGYADGVQRPFAAGLSVAYAY